MLHESGAVVSRGAAKERQCKGMEEWTGLRGQRSPVCPIHFKDTSTNKFTSLEYETGAVIPKSGDYIVSPFNADRTALVSDVTGDGKRNPLSILCAE
jgi:hypothetical protein